MKAKKKGCLWFMTIFLLFLIPVTIGGIAGVVIASLKNAPYLDELGNVQPSETTWIYDQNGNLITKLFEENRTSISITDMPKDMINAIVAIEDKNFFEHHGISIKGIIKAIWVDIVTRQKKRGASTITQQLARNRYLTLEKTWTRKINEIFLSFQIEHRYTKEEILELYLNEIYFGQGAYGIEAAAQVYFGKPAKDLSLSECALIAGLPKAPSAYSPYKNLEKAVSRRNLVLDEMVESGFITAVDAELAKNEQVKLVGIKNREDKAPYFVDYVVQQLINRYGENLVYRGGLRVYTTIDLKMQNAAQDALNNYLPRGRKDKNNITEPQGALVSIDPTTGYVKAMVGGRNYQESQLNRTTQAKRQPGSAFKPFVYTTAIDTGYTPASVIVDAPVSFGSWSPKNYDGRYHGAMDLRRALVTSNNVIAVKLLNEVGIERVVDTARKMGIQNLGVDDYNLSMALGGLTRGVTPLEMASAYAVLANQGVKIDPISILRVEDKDRNIIDKFVPKKRIIFSPQTAYTVTDMLMGVITSGTGRRASIGRPAAGKTGTTSDYRDAWFVGYTPDLVTSVWMGHDTPKKMPGTTGGSYPAAIWASFMKHALANKPVANFIVPEGVHIYKSSSYGQSDNANTQNTNKNNADTTTDNNNNTPDTQPSIDSPTTTDHSSNAHQDSIDANEGTVPIIDEPTSSPTRQTQTMENQ